MLDNNLTFINLPLLFVVVVVVIMNVIEC